MKYALDQPKLSPAEVSRRELARAVEIRADAARRVREADARARADWDAYLARGDATGPY